MKTLLTIYFYFNKIFRSNSCDFYKIKSWLFTLGVITLGTTVGWGQTYTYTFSNKIYDANNQTKTLGTANWILVNDGGYYGYENTKGQQLGSAKNSAKNITLSTSDISGTITTIEVETSGASGVSATVSASVDGVAYGIAQSITTTNTNYTFTGSSSGAIELKWNQTSSKALYIKKITITYTSSSPSTVTFNPNGGTGTMPSQTASSTTALTTNSFT